MRIRTVLVSLAWLFSFSAHAVDAIGTQYKTGIGFGGGTLANGVTGKLYLTPTTAVQAVVGQYAYYGYYGASGITLGVDFIQEMGSLVEVPNAGRLFWGIGVGGGAVMAGNTSAIGVSGVFELGWHFESYPIELTSDWRPTYYLGNAFLSGLYSGYGGGAIRYFF